MRISIRAVSLVITVFVMLIFGWSKPHAASYSEWSDPVPLGATVNSSVTDIAPAISKTGRSLYFSSTRPGGYGGFDMWVSRRASTSAPWGPPVNLGPNINTTSNDQGAAISRDGHLLFFVSDRPGGFGGQDIWVSWRAHTHDDFGWQPPVNVGPGVNSNANDHGPGYFENDDLGIPLLYFGSARIGGPGSDDIYVSALTPQGSFGPASLVEELSTPDADVGPDIRHDGLEIFFHSNRPGSFGLFDLWVSTRATVLDPWSEPMNLGILNSAFGDGQPSISSDRQTLFFFSNRPGGVGAADLYFTTRLQVNSE